MVALRTNWRATADAGSTQAAGRPDWSSNAFPSAAPASKEITLAPCATARHISAGY